MSMRYDEFITSEIEYLEGYIDLTIGSQSIIVLDNGQYAVITGEIVVVFDHVISPFSESNETCPAVMSGWDYDLMPYWSRYIAGKVGADY